MTAKDDAEDTWPKQPSPSWPAGCLIQNVAVHPTRPLLSASCTPSALLVFDAGKGLLRTTTVVDDELVGWLETRNAMRWSADGKRLTASVGTNGVALFERAALVGTALPDETRDSGVHHVFVHDANGDRLFTDNGAFFSIKKGDFGVVPERLAVPAFSEIEWNAKIASVVGATRKGFAAFEPAGRRVVYEQSLSGSIRVHVAPDGRTIAVRRLNGPAPDGLSFYSGDDGTALGPERAPTWPTTAEPVFSPDGSLFVLPVLGAYANGKYGEQAVDLFRAGRFARTITLTPRKLESASGVPECFAVAASPDASLLALLLDGDEIQIRDATTGAVRASFVSRPPPSHDDKWREAGALIFVGSERIAHVGPHFVSFFGIDGKKSGGLLAPPPRR